MKLSETFRMWVCEKFINYYYLLLSSYYFTDIYFYKKQDFNFPIKYIKSEIFSSKFSFIIPTFSLDLSSSQHPQMHEDRASKI